MLFVLSHIAMAKVCLYGGNVLEIKYNKFKRRSLLLVFKAYSNSYAEKLKEMLIVDDGKDLDKVCLNLLHLKETSAQMF